MSETGLTIPKDSIVSMFAEVPVVKELTTKLEKANGALMKILDTVQPPENDEDYEYNNQQLALVKDQYNKILALRKPITEQTDAFKEYMMQFERPFNPTSAKSNPYLEKRKLQEQYEQKKLDAKRKLEQETAKKKALENLKVDLKTMVLEKLSNNVIETVKKADEYARTLFNTLTVENFDEESERFKKQKPKLKQETYDNCFGVYKLLLDAEKSIITSEQFDEFITQTKAEETYDKWNVKIQEGVAPILNEWRAKIPDLKKELITRTNADAETKKHLEQEKAKRDAEDKATREQELQKMQQQNQQNLNEEAQLLKMGNELQSQAVIQQAGDTSAVTLVLKFTEDNKIGKALMQIMYHCMSHKDFPGIQKRDRTKKLIVDDKGRPEYVEGVQWWIDFFLKNCNAHVDGTTVFEDAKIQVRR